MMRRRVILRKEAKNVPAEAPCVLVKTLPMARQHDGGPPEVVVGRQLTITWGNHRAPARYFAKDE
jgi:hypothetical protein